ncbi:hypothetical protein AB6D11_00285 [Vibrio splendidus]
MKFILNSVDGRSTINYKDWDEFISHWGPFERASTGELITQDGITALSPGCDEAEKAWAIQYLLSRGESIAHNRAWQDSDHQSAMRKAFHFGFEPIEQVMDMSHYRFLGTKSAILFDKAESSVVDGKLEMTYQKMDRLINDMGTQIVVEIDNDTPSERIIKDALNLNEEQLKFSMRKDIDIIVSKGIVLFIDKQNKIKTIDDIKSRELVSGGYIVIDSEMNYGNVYGGDEFVSTNVATVHTNNEILIALRDSIDPEQEVGPQVTGFYTTNSHENPHVISAVIADTPTGYSVESYFNNILYEFSARYYDSTKHSESYDMTDLIPVIEVTRDNLIKLGSISDSLHVSCFVFDPNFTAENKDETVMVELKLGQKYDLRTLEDITDDIKMKRAPETPTNLDYSF